MFTDEEKIIALAIGLAITIDKWMPVVEEIVEGVKSDLEKIDKILGEEDGKSNGNN